MNKKNKRLILSLLIFGTILIGIGFSYAFFSFRQKTNGIELTMGDLYFKAEIDTNSVTIGNMFPMTLEDDPYTNGDYVDFSLISNIPNDTMYATVKLIEGEDYPGKVRIDDEFLHFSLKDLDNNTFIFEDKLCGLNGDIIFDTQIEPSTNPSDSTVTRNYRLYVWVGDEVIISDTDPKANYKSSNNGKSYLNKFSDLFCSFGFEIEGAAYQLLPDTTELSNIDNLNVYFGTNSSSPDYSKVKKVIFAKTTDEYVSEYEAETYDGKKVIVSATDSEVPIYVYVRYVNNDENNREIVFFSDNVIKMPSNMSNLFESYTNLTTVDFSNSDWSAVTNLSFAFYETKIESLILPHINNLINASYLFNNCLSLKYVDFSNVDKMKNIDLSYAFNNCLALEEVVFGHIKYESTSGANFTLTFRNCSSLKSIDLSKFDFSNGVNFNSTFYNCFMLQKLILPNNHIECTNVSEFLYGCDSLKKIDLSDFSYTGIVEFSNMFKNCRSLEYLDLSGFHNTKPNTNISDMFNGCTELKEVTGFVVDSARDASNLFKNCTSLKSVDLSRINFSSLTSFNNAFYGCSSLEYLDLSNFNPTNTISMDYTFSECTSLKGIGFGNNNIHVSNMCQLFYHCSSLLGIDATVFDTTNCTNFTNIFCGCSSLIELDLSTWTYDLASPSTMFSSNNSLIKLIAPGIKHFGNFPKKLEYLDLSGINIIGNLTFPKSLKKLIMKNAIVSGSIDFNLSSDNYSTSQIRYVDFTGSIFTYGFSASGILFSFSGYTNLETVILKNVELSNTIYLKNLFKNCTSLNRVDFSGFNVPYLSDMESMFEGCTSLTKIDMTWFGCTGLYNFNYMFKNCTSLTTIYSNLDWSSHSGNCNEMFTNCFNLEGGTGYHYQTGYDQAWYTTPNHYFTAKG